LWRLRGGQKGATTMKQYKGHPIYGVAVSAPEHRWISRGLVFDPDLNQTVEIQRIQCPDDLSFQAKRQAEEHGLKLCRDWIDEQASAAISR
jgi:hypothetical protein